MASLTAWLPIVAKLVGKEKGKEKGVSSSPRLPTPTAHHTPPPSLHCETVEQTYFLQELKWVSKVVSTLITHIWLADLIAQSFSTQTSGQVCPGGSSRFTALSFLTVQFSLSTTSGLFTKDIFMYILYSVLSFCQICFCILDE